MLLEECLNDAKSQGKDGIIAVTSDKKYNHFLSDKKFFQMQGFEFADKSEPYFELWYKKLNENSSTPKFKEIAKKGEISGRENEIYKNGISVYFSNGCPFTEFYVKELEEVAKKQEFEFHSIKIETKEQAQNHFVPFTIYSIFKDGKFVTQHILTEKSFNKFIK